MTVEIRYVKRLLMACDFSQTLLKTPALPEGYFWTEWNPNLNKTHARLVHLAFCNDLDGRIFPTFRQFAACEHLINATFTATSFVPEATWLIGRYLEKSINGKLAPFEYCAAIQCVRKKKNIGEIQNVSVIPDKRRQGLGRALVSQALLAFKKIGVKKVMLEATAENFGAIRMYDSLGFQSVRYFYTESFVDC